MNTWYNCIIANFPFFQEQIDKNYLEITEANAKASAEKCRRLLAELERTLVTNLKDGRYAKSGGFIEYQEELQMIRAKYESTPGLGVQVRLFCYRIGQLDG